MECCDKEETVPFPIFIGTLLDLYSNSYVKSTTQENYSSQEGFFLGGPKATFIFCREEGVGFKLCNNTINVPYYI